MCVWRIRRGSDGESMNPNILILLVYLSIVLPLGIIIYARLVRPLGMRLVWRLVWGGLLLFLIVFSLKKALIPI